MFNKTYLGLGSLAIAVLVTMMVSAFAAVEEVELADGNKVQAEYGHITVPERRDRPNSDKITIPYIKVLAEGDRTGPPLIYLRGGPGNSGTKILEKEFFATLVHKTAVGRDVVLFDQRGTGDARPDIRCGPSAVLPLKPAPSRDELFNTVSELASNCADQMREQGIDLTGYNTNESADDVADLAKHLGFDRIVLFGMSYGSHLGLAVIRRHEALVERAILGLILGLDDTFDRPHQFDEVLSYVDEIARDPGSKWPYSEPPSSAIEQLLEQFNTPQQASWIDKYDRRIETEINRIDLERIIFRYLWDDEKSWRNLPRAIERLRKGDFSREAKSVTKRRRMGIDPMKAAMRCASGASDERLALIEDELKSSVVSTPPGFPYRYVCDSLGVKPLPARFRKPVISDVPVLLISGELDGNTPPSNAEEVAKGLSRAAHVRVTGIGHNYWGAYKKSRELRDAVSRFLDGKELSSARYSVPFKFKGLKDSRS